MNQVKIKLALNRKWISQCLTDDRTLNIEDLPTDPPRLLILWPLITEYKIN